MREILFRGKQAYNDEWAYSEYPFGTIHCGAVVHDFIPETIGQYTGLIDKNGKKIFEGDIVRTLAPTSTDIYIEGVVMFGEYQTAFQSSNIGYYVNWLLNKNLAIYCKINDIEVIGNIHDNPELLEGE